MLSKTSGILLDKRSCGTPRLLAHLSRKPKPAKPDTLALEWKAVTSQELVSAPTQSDGRLRATASFGIDVSRLEMFKSAKQYVANVDLNIVNLSPSKITYRDSAVHLLTSSGLDLSVKDMQQSWKGMDFDVAPRKMTGGTGALFVLDAPDRAAKLVYNDGKSRFIWTIKGRPKT